MKTFVGNDAYSADAFSRKWRRVFGDMEEGNARLCLGRAKVL